MNRVIRVFLYLVKLVLAFFISFFIKVFRPEMRNIWLVSERGDDARDNGFFFFKYMIKNHPEIKVFYVIDNKSSDSHRIIQDYSIEKNSFRHFIFFALCRVRISSHAWGGDVPEVDYYRKLGFYKHTKKKWIFLQHGITKDFLPSLCYPVIRPDVFVCGADPEWRYIHNSFRHPEGVVQYTGLARYDSLCDFVEKDQVLIMPTFRKFLQGLSEIEFCNESYYSFWQSFLESPDLSSLLEKYKLNLLFYPHYEMQRYVNLFHGGSGRVIIADFNHFDVQTLLKESKLMITDYSSVFFDFSYMKKPVIFYQFDRNRYINEHYDYTKGYFNYDTMAPGKVVFEEKELLRELEKVINLNFEVDNEYSIRRDSFFQKSDQHNCDRIYDAITDLR